jgi:hypothetical protein
MIIGTGFKKARQLGMELMNEKKIIIEIDRLKKELNYFYFKIFLSVGLILFLIGFNGTLLLNITKPDPIHFGTESSLEIITIFLLFLGLGWLIVSAIIEKTKFKQIHRLKTQLKLLRAEKEIGK